MVELMVVITILGMLAGLVAMNTLVLGDKAAVQLTKTQIVEVDQAVKTFLAERRRLPEDLDELIGSGSTAALDSEDLPLDAWGYELTYEKLGSREYTIVSLGADGAEGGEGIDADLDVRAAKRRPRADETK